MAIIFMDSFDYYGSLTDNHYYTISGSRDNYPGYILSTGGRWGSNCWTGGYASGECGAYRVLNGSYQTITFGGANYHASNATVGLMALCEANGTIQLELSIDSIGHLVLTRNGLSSPTQLWIWNDLLTIGWHYLELSAYIDNSAGWAEIRVDGARVALLSGIDTQNGTTPYVGRLNLGCRDYGPNVGSNGMRWDDVYLTDDTSPNSGLLGDTRIQYLVPTSAGTRTQFTPSAGSNWQNVDETGGVSWSDYNNSNVPGAIDSFTMANVATDASVYAVSPVLNLAKDDAGYRSGVPLILKPDGNRFYLLDDPTSASTSVSYTRPDVIWNISPDTGLVWSREEINDMEYGYMVADVSLFTIDAVVGV